MTMQVTTQAKGIYTDVEFSPQEYLPDSVFLQAATMAGSIEGDSPYVRVPYVSQDPTVGFATEGSEIIEGDPTLDEKLISTAKLAVLVTQSRESATFATASQLLTASLLRTLSQKVDYVFLRNAVTAGQPTGLVNYPGTATGPTWGGTDTTGDLNAIATAISTVEANNGTASHIIMSPTTWLHYASLKNKNDDYQLGQPGSATTRQLWGVPVLTSTQAPDDKIIVLDKLDVIAASTGLQMAQSDQAAFTKDSILWRCTWRLGWTLVHPERTVILSKNATGA